MKQIIASVFPDKATAWKLAAMVLLLLLALVLIVNSIAPFARAVFSPGDTVEGSGTVQEDPSLMAHYMSENAIQEEQARTALENQVAEAETHIAQYEQQIADMQTMVDELTAKGQADEETIAQLNEQIALLTEERDAAVSQLQQIREEQSMDHTIVVKITRDDWLPGIDVLTFNLHVSAEEYAMYQVGDTVQPLEGLDFPVSSEWTAVVSSMYINYIDI